MLAFLALIVGVLYFTAILLELVCLLLLKNQRVKPKTKRTFYFIAGIVKLGLGILSTILYLMNPLADNLIIFCFLFISSAYINFHFVEKFDKAERLTPYQ